MEFCFFFNRILEGPRGNQCVALGVRLAQAACPQMFDISSGSDDDDDDDDESEVLRAGRS